MRAAMSGAGGNAGQVTAERERNADAVLLRLPFFPRFGFARNLNPVVTEGGCAAAARHVRASESRCV